MTTFKDTYWKLSEDERYRVKIRAIATALIKGDEEVIQKFGMTSRTIKRWRSEAKRDKPIGIKNDVATMKKVIETQWVKECKEVIELGLLALKERVKVAKSIEDAKVIDSLTKSINTCYQMLLGAGIMLDIPEDWDWNLEVNQFRTKEQHRRHFDGLYPTKSDEPSGVPLRDRLCRAKGDRLA
ncbi:MAG: hypothetical protein F6K50_06315 [Moorea sp. SIO3I7]|nr:hypothetical protein [Moorena sp. SIO3I7]